MTDEQLVSAARAGDDRAYEHLYARYQRRITGYVLGMVGDHGRAEDLTQDVFIAGLRRLRATERPIAFKPWIFEIAKNACIDQYRRSRRTDEVPYDDHAVDRATPDTAIDAKQQVEDLVGAFGSLSDAHHEILVLRELEGRSYQEIGDRLGISRPSVESTLFRARRRLGEEYDELTSGERCRQVQGMLTAGRRIGRRDERRVGRHLAHCQPCRRHAAASGFDLAALAPSRRRVALGKVAAFLPLPAFLRLRDNALTQWGPALSSSAEPAVGWGKAATAAVALLVAGGAGAVGHGASRPEQRAPETRAPLTQPARAAERPAARPDRAVKPRMRKRATPSSGRGTRADRPATAPVAAPAPERGRPKRLPKPASTPQTAQVRAPVPELPAPVSRPDVPAVPELDLASSAGEPETLLPGEAGALVQRAGEQVRRTVQGVAQTDPEVLEGLDAG